MKKRRQNFEEWEDQILVKHYGKLTAREIQKEFLPHRSIDTIYSRARVYLKLRSKQSFKWERVFAKKLSPTIWAYLAGILDGEGTITILFGKKRRGRTRAMLPMVGISNQNKALMDWIQKTFQLHLVNRKGISGFGAPKGLQAIATAYPFVRWILKRTKRFLIIKKPHAELVLKFIENRAKRDYGSHYTWEDFNILLEVRKLNVGHRKNFSALESSLRQKFEEYLKFTTSQQPAATSSQMIS